MSEAPTNDIVANELYVRAKELEASGSVDPNGKQKLLRLSTIRSKRT